MDTASLVDVEPLGYQSTVNFKYSPAPSTEYLQIDGRYTVRGFDGNTTLAGPGGWTWRNEVAMATLCVWGQVYTAVDTGQISPIASREPRGKMLIGSAIGLRGNVNTFGYDIALGGH